MSGPDEVRSLRFTAPAHNAQQWTQERANVLYVADGPVQFVPGSDWLHFAGIDRVPEGHNGVISVIRVTVIDNALSTTAANLRWSLQNGGGVIVPGYQDRLCESSSVVTPDRAINGTLSGTLAGILTGFPSALCPAGCDYVTQQIGAAPFNWVSAATLSMVDPQTESRQVAMGMQGVIVPVWLQPGDQYQLVLRRLGTGGDFLIHVSIGGALWPA